MTHPSPPKRPRRFAPLDPDKEEGMERELPALRGIVFDVDGTLCEPQNYMFAQMRSALSIPPTTDILTHIYSLPASQQDPAMATIRSIEAAAMELQKPQPGLVTLMQYLEYRGVRRGICTRNFDLPVSHLLSTFLPSYLQHAIHPILTRAFRPPKPHPAGILHIAEVWKKLSSDELSEEELLSKEERAEGLIMVGDSLDDLSAGHHAGAATVLLLNESNRELQGHAHTDLVVERLDELVGVLEGGFVGVED